MEKIPESTGIRKYFEQIDVFADELQKALDTLGITHEVEGLVMDHVCLRIENSLEVDALRTELAEYADEISFTAVNGRNIMIFQLHKPMQVGQWAVQGIELPYPKKQHSYGNRWEHVEFVLSDADNTMGGLREILLSTFVSLDKDSLRRDFKYKESKPHAEGDQLANPTIGLKVNGIGIKFHTYPIQEVVK